MPTHFLKQSLFFLATLIFLCSCKTSKQLSYFKNLPEDSLISRINTLPYEPLKLQTNDEVQVTISSPSPEASQFFNLTLIPPVNSTGNQPQTYISIYRVSSNGLITLPVLGDIKAAGLTMEELKSEISSKLKNYLKEAIVIVRLTNFKVTVIGEVGKPVVIPVEGQTINVLEAVGAAGDLTVYGIRKNVKVIRKLPGGATEVALLNFNDVNVLKSPYFQLRQNDIVYVHPNKNKGLLGSTVNLWIPVVTSVIYLAAIIISSN